MPEIGERQLAQEFRGVGLSANGMPEWKKDAFGKTPFFGQRRSKLSSIQDQRESLFYIQAEEGTDAGCG